MKILDIGSGHNPNPKANIFLERYLDSNDVQRGGAKAKIPTNLILGDAEYLPFKDRSIDLIISNHLIEHLDHPDKFLEECQRVGLSIKHTAPGIVHHVFGEIFFGGVGKGIHKYVWNPVSKTWLDVEILRKAYPNYTPKQKIYIKTIKLIPRRLRELIFATMIHIIARYLENMNIDIVEYTYEVSATNEAKHK